MHTASLRGWAVRLAMVFSVFAASCGGGGGGGSDPGTGSGGGGGGSTSGLVPAAPALGSTLYADAALLRPVRDGAVWNYRGVATAYAGAEPKRYTTATTQSATSATSGTEAFSNAGNDGASSQAINISSGTVGWQERIDFAGKGINETVQFVELKSPVRQGDQYTMHDRRYADTDIDVDGDNKPDTLDVAIYARVIGMETVDLPNLPAQRAVRVDTFVVSRITRSSNGVTSPVSQATLQTWYAAGVGIVRQISTVPNDAGTDKLVTDEVLSSWDGVSTGLGSLAPRLGVVPAGSPAFGGALLQSPFDGLQTAVAFDDHALVFARSPDSVFSSMVSRIDLRGNVVSARALPDLAVTSFGHTLRAGTGVVYLRQLQTGNQTQLGLTRMDADGALIGAIDGITLELGGTRLAPRLGRFDVAVDGSTLWVLWQRSYVVLGVGFADELVLRAYGTDGAPQTAELVLDTTASANLELTAGAGQALMAWTRVDGGHDVLYANATVAGGAQVKTLASGLASSNSFVRPLRLDTGGALLWTAQLGTGSSLPNASGVRLDAAFTPVRSAATLDGEALVGIPPFFSGSPGAAALGGRIVVSTAKTGLLWPEDSDTQPLGLVAWMESGTQALATQTVRSVVRAGDDSGMQLVYPDRVLLFGGRTRFTTTVVWLNSGAAP